MTDTQSAIAGRTLGRYQLLASVARGGMGQVWLGRLQGARGFHKLVAVKTLLAPAEEAGRFERMMLEEARIASLIHHPNVVHTLELGEDDGTLYLVMEWVDGEPLTHVVAKAKERGGLPLGVAVEPHRSDASWSARRARALRCVRRFARCRSPRRVAAQRARGVLGHGEAPRLRHCQGDEAKVRRHRDGRSEGKVRVHGPRAGARNGHGSADGPVCRRHHALHAHRRPTPVQAPQRRRRFARHHEREPGAAALELRPRLSARAGSRRDEGPREGHRAPLCDGRRDAPRARARGARRRAPRAMPPSGSTLASSCPRTRPRAARPCDAR